MQLFFPCLSSRKRTSLEEDTKVGKRQALGKIQFNLPNNLISLSRFCFAKHFVDNATETDDSRGFAFDKMEHIIGLRKHIVHPIMQRPQKRWYCFVARDQISLRIIYGSTQRLFADTYISLITSLLTCVSVPEGLLRYNAGQLEAAPPPPLPSYRHNFVNMFTVSDKSSNNSS